MRTPGGTLAAALVLAACGGSDGGGGGNGDSTVAAALDGLRWELPCVTNTTAELCTTPAGDPTVSAALTGTAGASYDVTLRFRGVVEPKTYTGGARTGWFQTGGTPASDTANIYRLTVSNPAQTFYVNAGTTRASNALYCEAFDYQATVRAAAGATFTLQAQPLDALQIRNRDQAGTAIVVAGVPPAPQAYAGQFVQMDVVSVAKAP